MWGCHLRHTHALRAVGWQDAQSFAIGTLFWFMVSEDTTIPGSTPAAHSVPDVPYKTLHMRSEGVKLSSFNSIPYHTIPCHAMPCHAIPYHVCMLESGVRRYEISKLSKGVFTNHAAWTLSFEARGCATKCGSSELFHLCLIITECLHNWA